MKNMIIIMRQCPFKFLNLIMKPFIFLLTLMLTMISSTIDAQIQYAELGVDGLTCSQCTRNVELALRKLDFVQDVEMNIENTKGKILFKPDRSITIEDLSKAVFDAGFSVRYLKIAYLFNNQEISENYCLEDQTTIFEFIEVKKQLLSGIHLMQLVGKSYQNRKEYRLWKGKLNNNCKQQGKVVYHVTL
jgi:copper chaperone CopZ